MDRHKTKKVLRKHLLEGKGEIERSGQQQFVDSKAPKPEKSKENKANRKALNRQWDFWYNNKTGSAWKYGKPNKPPRVRTIRSDGNG